MVDGSSLSLVLRFRNGLCDNNIYNRSHFFHQRIIDDGVGSRSSICSDHMPYLLLYLHSLSAGRAIAARLLVRIVDCLYEFSQQHFADRPLNVDPCAVADV